MTPEIIPLILISLLIFILVIVIAWYKAKYDIAIELLYQSQNLVDKLIIKQKETSWTKHIFNG